MGKCTCISKHHENHPGKACDESVKADETYCRECLDKQEKENADTAPDLLSYRPR